MLAKTENGSPISEIVISLFHQRGAAEQFNFKGALVVANSNNGKV